MYDLTCGMIPPLGPGKRVDRCKTAMYHRFLNPARFPSICFTSGVPKSVRTFGICLLLSFLSKALADYSLKLCKGFWTGPMMIHLSSGLWVFENAIDISDVKCRQRVVPYFLIGTTLWCLLATWSGRSPLNSSNFEWSSSNECHCELHLLSRFVSAYFSYHVVDETDFVKPFVVLLFASNRFRCCLFFACARSALWAR